MISANENIAVISNGPLYEGLTMMIVSQRLKTEGRKNVVTFSNHLYSINTWFCIHEFSKLPDPSKIKETFKDFNTLILMYRNDAFCNECIKIFRSKDSNTKIFVFYPHNFTIKMATNIKDIFFHKRWSMVDNTTFNISKILQTKHHSKSNGLSPPLNLNLLHRKYAKRVLIEKNVGSEKKLNTIASHLKKIGFTPHFLDPKQSCENIALIYESGYFIGIGQTDISILSSNLYIPSLILNKSTLPKIYQSGWLNQVIITPPLLLRKFTLPFVKRTLSAFKDLVINHHELIS
tara:strand:- start:2262 stop:3131 length:870 start_codon:yes stop_codon:yes gene_type:complete